MADYYLPAGKWTDFFTGEVKEGGRWIQEKHGYLSVPLLVKENSIVALGAHDDKPDYDYGDGVELRVYELKDGVAASTVVYGMDESEEVKVTAVRNGNTITVDVASDKAYSVRLVNVTATGLEGTEAVVDGNDTILTNVSGHMVCAVNA